MQWYWNSFQKVFPALTRHFSIFNKKSRKIGILAKIYIFGKVLFLLFLLRFGVPRCCFFKSMIFQLSFAQKIIKKALLVQKLCQFEIYIFRKHFQRTKISHFSCLFVTKTVRWCPRCVLATKLEVYRSGCKNAWKIEKSFEM